jgi:hypothetical protein
MCSTRTATTQVPEDVPVVSPLIDDYESSEITSPVFDDTKKIGKIGVGLV